MKSGEFVGFDDRRIGSLFQDYKSIALAHGGSFQDLTAANQRVKVDFIPAGTLEAEDPGFADHPSNLIDRIVVSIRELHAPDIRLILDFESEDLKIIPPEKVEKDFEINSQIVSGFHNSTMLGPESPFLENALSPSSDEPLDPEANKAAMEAFLTETREMYLELPFEYPATGAVLNPFYLRKYRAPREVISIATKMAELARGQLHAFNEKDFRFLLACLDKLN